MNTIKVRSVFVESKNTSSNIWGVYGLLESLEKGTVLTLVNEEVAKINLHESLEIYKEKLIKSNWKPYLLILIYLDKKIGVGDLVTDGIDLCRIVDLNNQFYYIETLDGRVRLENKPIYLLKGLSKVIATQDQLSPELIQQLIDEYNNGGMKDFEIEMEKLYSCEATDEFDAVGFCGFRPKLTNGFVTVVKEENYHFPLILQVLLDKKAEASNTIDLDAYAKGLLDCYNAQRDPISYTEEDCYRKLHRLMMDIKLNGVVINDDIDLKKWFNQNKKK